jgi:hypothetical protein
MSDSSNNNYTVTTNNISSFEQKIGTIDLTIGEIGCICSDQSGSFIYCFATTTDSSFGYIYCYDSATQMWDVYFDGSCSIPFSCITTNNEGNVVVACTNSYYQGGNSDKPQSTLYCSSDFGLSFPYFANFPANIIDVTISGNIENNSETTNNIVFITETECYCNCLTYKSTNQTASLDNVTVSLLNIQKADNSSTRIFTSVSITNNGSYFAVSSTNTNASLNDSTTLNDPTISGIYIFSNYSPSVGYQCIQVLNNIQYPYSFFVSLSSYESTSTKSETYYDLTVIASNDNSSQSENTSMLILYYTTNYDEESLTNYGTTNNNTVTDINNQSDFYDVSGSLIDSNNQFVCFETSNSGEFQIVITPTELFITNNYGVSWYQQDINVLTDDETYTSLGVTSYDVNGMLTFYVGTNEGHIWQISTDISGVIIQILDGSTNTLDGSVVTTVKKTVTTIKEIYNNIQSQLKSHKSLLNFLMIWPYIIHKIVKDCIILMYLTEQWWCAIFIMMFAVFGRWIYMMVVVWDPLVANLNLESSGNHDLSGNKRKKSDFDEYLNKQLAKCFVLWFIGVRSTKQKIRQWFLTTFGIEEAKVLIETFIQEVKQNMEKGDTFQEAVANIIAPLLMEVIKYLVIELHTEIEKIRTDIYKFIKKLINTFFSKIEGKITTFFDDKIS